MAKSGAAGKRAGPIIHELAAKAADPAEAIRQEIAGNDTLRRFLTERYAERTCPIDGNKFTPKTRWQAFCCTTCRNRWHAAKRRAEGT